MTSDTDKITEGLVTSHRIIYSRSSFTNTTNYNVRYLYSMFIKLKQNPLSGPSRCTVTYQSWIFHKLVGID